MFVCKSTITELAEVILREDHVKDHIEPSKMLKNNIFNPNKNIPYYHINSIKQYKIMTMFTCDVKTPDFQLKHIISYF